MINFFKSLFWMLIVWTIIYSFEIYKGWTTDNFYFQTFLCTLYFLNALVSVPHYESREITYRLSHHKAKDLYEGIHFFPFLGFWGQIYTPNEYRSEEKSFIHFDSRQVIRKRKVKSRLEDFLISLIFPMFRKFELWNLAFCFILGLGLSWSSINIKKTFFSKKTEVAYNVPQQQQPAYQNQTNSYNSNPNTTQNQNSNQKNYSYSKDKYGYEIRKDENGVIEYKAGDGSWVSESVAMEQIDNNYIYKYYNPSITWDNLSANYNDNYLIIQKMSNNIDYIEEEGFFVRSSTSAYYYPHVYVDGFDKDQDFFYQFFKVEIISLSLANGETWKSTEMELKDYVDLIRYEKVVNGNYKHIKFVVKDKFKNKYSWHIMDAGFGNGNTAFKICYKSECVYSFEEKNRLGINN